MKLINNFILPLGIGYATSNLISSFRNPPQFPPIGSCLPLHNNVINPFGNVFKHSIHNIQNPSIPAHDALNRKKDTILNNLHQSVNHINTGKYQENKKDYHQHRAPTALLNYANHKIDQALPGALDRLNPIVDKMHEYAPLIQKGSEFERDLERAKKELQSYKIEWVEPDKPYFSEAVQSDETKFQYYKYDRYPELQGRIKAHEEAKGRLYDKRYLLTEGAGNVSDIIKDIPELSQYLPMALKDPESVKKIVIAFLNNRIEKIDEDIATELVNTLRHFQGGITPKEDNPAYYLENIQRALTNKDGGFIENLKNVSEDQRKKLYLQMKLLRIYLEKNSPYKKIFLAPKNLYYKSPNSKLFLRTRNQSDYFDLRPLSEGGHASDRYYNYVKNDGIMGTDYSEWKVKDPHKRKRIIMEMILKKEKFLINNKNSHDDRAFIKDNEKRFIMAERCFFANKSVASNIAQSIRYLANSKSKPIISDINLNQNSIEYYRHKFYHEFMKPFLKEMTELYGRSREVINLTRAICHQRWFNIIGGEETSMNIDRGEP